MISVSHSTQLNVPARRAWAIIRDFNAMPAWNDTVKTSRIEDGPADRVSCRRVLVFDDGGTWTHLLTGLSDEDMKLQYSIVGTPPTMRIPVWDYRASLQVFAGPDREATCQIEWQASFETDKAEEMSLRAKQVFERGFQGLAARLERSTP